MPNYFYIDTNGQRSDPLNEQQLQAMVEHGVITQTTPLETDTGHRGVAGQIPGLKFNTAVPPRRSVTYSQTEESAGTAWLFDFSFQNIRLQKNGRRVCSFIYICCFITLAINGLLGFFLLNPMYSPEAMTAAVIFLVCYLVSAYIFLVLVRVTCEFLIVLLDYINQRSHRA